MTLPQTKGAFWCACNAADRDQVPLPGPRLVKIRAKSPQTCARRVEAAVAVHSVHEGVGCIAAVGRVTR